MSRLKSRAQDDGGALTSGALIELVYRAVSRPELWQKVFISIGRLVGSRGTTLVFRGHGSVRSVDCDGPAAGLVDMSPVQLFSNKAVSRRSFVMAVAGGEVIDDWAQLPSDNSTSTLSLYTHEGSSSHGTEGLLRAILPHAHRALLLSLSIQDLARERDDLRAVVDELSCGVALLDTNGSVLYCNDVASELFGLGAGLHSEGGRLRAADVEDHESLMRLVAEVASEPSGPLRAMRLSNGFPLFMRGSHGGRVLMFLRPGGQQSSIPSPLLAEAFALSHSESRVGSLFAAGHGPETVASELGVSVATVRDHLREMRERAGVDSDVGLVRRYLDGVPRIAKY